MLQNSCNIFKENSKGMSYFSFILIVFNCSKGKKRNEGNKYTNANPFEETPMMPVRA